LRRGDAGAIVCLPLSGVAVKHVPAARDLGHWLELSVVTLKEPTHLSRVAQRIVIKQYMPRGQNNALLRHEPAAESHARLDLAVVEVRRIGCRGPEIHHRWSLSANRICEQVRA